MKKKLLFLFLLLIPFMVKAETAADLVKMWEFSDNILYDGIYNSENTFIRYNRSTFVSIDRITGKRNTLLFDSEYNDNYLYNYDIFHMYKDNQVLIIIGKDNKVTATLYDEYLKEIKTTKLDNFDIDYCARYFGNILVSGNKFSNNGYYRVVYLLDYEGNIIQSDSIKTINNTTTHRLNDNTSWSYDNVEPIFVDNNNNTYKLDEDYKLYPTNLNNDGTYMIVQDTLISKYTRTGEFISSVEIPDGKGTRGAKKGNNYYLSTGVYTIEEKSSGKYTYITVRLYQIDENLNVLKTVDVNQQSQAGMWGEITSPLRRYYHDIENDKGTIYYTIYKNTGTPYCYKLDEELYSTNYNNCQNYYNFVLSGDYNLTALNDRNDTYYIDEYVNESTVNTILAKRGLTSDNAYVIYNKDGENTAALVANYTSESLENSSGYRVTTTLDLVYYDKDYNEIFSKNIYDGDLTQNGRFCGSQIIASNIDFFDNKYIVIATNSIEKSYLQIYDKEGNLVRDLSSDFNNKYLSFKNLVMGSRGMYVEFNYSSVQCSQGVSETINHTLVASESEEENNNNELTHTIYYAYPFKVNTLVKGEGIISSKVVRALEGDVIEFTVEPKPGYVLGAVTVTDMYGNVLTFTDYKFVMPYADVTIEATFLPINPKTEAGKRVIIAIILCLISIVLLIGYFKNEKQIEEV